ncbi:MAG: methyltransferase domain-containing protein [Micromonosporaceae bacterium]|nr:methyltransferase domain-containing protein [Micromonosporaceae bacterium]
MADVEDYVTSNRHLWDEWADIHAAGDWYDLDSVRRGADKLRPYEVQEVGDVNGLTMLHLQCQIGTDSVSWARRGAKVTGVDFSPRAVEIANALAKELGVDATFVCADVMNLPEVLPGIWDAVYTSRGVLGWLPDLTKWARMIADYLKPGGFMYLTDIHPIAKVLDDTSSDLRVARPYWPRPEPIAYGVDGTYADPTAKVSTTVKYLWTHSTGELITAVGQAGLIIEFFHEFEWLDRPWPCLRKQDDRHYVLPQNAGAELPLFFSLRARKPL